MSKEQGMTEDRQRLEDAARAAGWETAWNGSVMLRLNKWVDENDGECSAWVECDPDNDYGDCFRLMVDAGIAVDVGIHGLGSELVQANYFAEDRYYESRVEFGGNKAAATKKAILDCAAAIGRARRESGAK